MLINPISRHVYFVSSFKSTRYLNESFHFSQSEFFQEEEDERKEENLKFEMRIRIYKQAESSYISRLIIS